MQHPLEVTGRILKLQMLLMAPYYVIPIDEVDPELIDPLRRYPRIAHTLLLFLKKARSDSGMDGLFLLLVDLITVSMAHSGYSELLINFLELLVDNQPPISESQINPMAKYLPKLLPSIGQYLDVRFNLLTVCQRVI